MTDRTQTLFSFAQQLGVILPLHAMVGADAALAVLTDPRGVWSEKSWLWDAALPVALACTLAHFGPELKALLP
jgi:hypothetical protein